MSTVCKPAIKYIIYDNYKSNGCVEETSNAETSGYQSW